MTIVDDARVLDGRIRAAFSRSEWLALIGSITVLSLCTGYHVRTNHIPFDYYAYVIIADGTWDYFYYGYWIVPLFIAMSKIPFFVGYYLWGLLNIAGTIFATRIFGGRVLPVLMGFQLLYTLYFGSISGVIIGCLAIGWWAISHQRWSLAGLVFLVAMAKLQTGGVSVVLLLFLARISNMQRLRILVIPLIGAAISLILYPGWPAILLARLNTNPPNDMGSISLWRWLGPFAMLIFLPPILFSMPRATRFLALLTAAALGLPYFQQTDLLFLFALPPVWPALLGNLGFLFVFFRWEVLRFLFVVPLFVYIFAILMALKALWSIQANSTQISKVE